MSIHERLKIARQQCGLTLAQVNERTEIGQSTLSDYENNKREPGISQLQKLATAYHKSISFFLSEGQIPEEKVFWRKLPKEGQKDIEGRFLRLCEQYHNLEVWTGDVINKSLPVLVSEATKKFDADDAEDLAVSILNQYQFGNHPAQSLQMVLEEICGVKIFHMSFEPSGTAVCVKSKTFGNAVLLNSGNARWRRNFDLAHELFHLLTCNIFEEASKDNKVESMANRFASHLLMPSDAVRSAIHRSDKPTLETLYNVARQFDVSTDALIWRLYNLRMLKMTQDQVREMACRASELSGYMEGQRESYPTPPLLPERYKNLAIRAFSKGMMSMGRFAEYIGITRQQAMGYRESIQATESMEDEEIPFAVT